MNILKWLLNIRQDLEVEQLIQEATNKPPTPKDIGEPVLSMVEIIKKYPKRFEFDTHSYISSFVDHTYFTFKDGITGSTFKVGFEQNYKYDCRVLEGIFTADEAILLHATLQEIETLRTKKVNEYLQIRKDRNRVNQRAKLTEYYQGELLK